MKKTLAQLRAAIDRIDTEIITLVAARQTLARAIATKKIETEKPVRDPVRETKLLADRTKKAEKKGLSARDAMQLFSLLMKISRTAQTQFLREKKRLTK